MKTSLSLAAFISLLSFGAHAQMDTLQNNQKIGNMTVSAFKAANEKGNQMVSAITPSKTPLSSADQQLFLKVMMGGQMQLAMSQAAMGRVTDPQVRLLAQSEVEEQTGVAAKLQEIARAKGMQPPAAGPDSSIQNMTRKLEGMSGNDLNTFYVEQSGIKGHELLQQTMTTVNSQATDESLKKLATGTLPVIRMHLSVSKEVKTKLGSGSSTSTSSTK